MSQETYHCERCGSTHIREVRWFDPNRNEVCEDVEGLELLSGYCDECSNTTTILLKSDILYRSDYKDRYYAWPEAQEHLQCKHSAMLTGDDDIVVPACVCKLGLINEGGDSCEFYLEIEEPKEDEISVSNASKTLNEVFTGMKEIFSPKASNDVPERCESCSDINTTGSVVTCNIILRESGKFIPIPDVTKRPGWCPKDDTLTDEECKNLWNDMFPNDPIK